MPEKIVEKASMLTEDKVVEKVTELMETLDHVKEYNALYNSFKTFALIVIGSLSVFLAIGGSLNFLNFSVTPGNPEFFLLSILLLLIPVSGIIVGILFIRKRVKSAKKGEWKKEIEQGFPSALKILMEIDWDKTFEEISLGRVGYALYGLLKAAAYWIISLFIIGIIGNSIFFLIHPQGGFFAGPILFLFSILIVYFLARHDLAVRYKEIRALDKLLWELRWFSNELGRAEF
ncbi:MAG: hypothetical protein ACFCUE_00005 [Candidatus Bathyarchaeia archaeon]|jgi:hypothetical protein